MAFTWAPREQSYFPLPGWHREDDLTSTCHEETNAELSLHSHVFSLSKHAPCSFDSIAFLPGMNISESFTFVSFLVGEKEKKKLTFIMH